MKEEADAAEGEIALKNYPIDPIKEEEEPPHDEASIQSDVSCTYRLKKSEKKSKNV